MTLLAAVMHTQHMTEAEARQEIADARKDLFERLNEPDVADLHDFCEERWGLEPDYLPDLIG